MLELGGAPQLSAGQAQNTLVAVLSWMWSSRPMTGSKDMVVSDAEVGDGFAFQVVGAGVDPIDLQVAAAAMLGPAARQADAQQHLALLQQLRQLGGNLGGLAVGP